MLTGEHVSIVSVGAPQAGSKQLTHWTGETVYSIAVKLQGFHKHPPPHPTWPGDLTGHCFTREEDLQGAEWNRGRHG